MFKPLFRAALAILQLESENWLALTDQGEVLAYAKTAARNCHDCQQLLRCGARPYRLAPTSSPNHAHLQRKYIFTSTLML